LRAQNSAQQAASPLSAVRCHFLKDFHAACREGDMGILEMSGILQFIHRQHLRHPLITLAGRLTNPLQEL
jgi:hypothetical protein